ncbi:LTA synthase family protein [Leptospira idonii]|uniref:Alkaline phosphatase family protein n=1 Tax=Leptospira idonii TaxID=1193500 RepID=A0A4R9M2K5_9LEPT|nr:alkaline phosphatase family protein [Leptospira idonii]TGN20211.1 alkaline phosphatase family protein [Leptospira idonii]
MLKKIPSHLKMILFLAAYYLVILTLYRFAFLYVYSYRLEGVNVYEILSALVLGLRFDISTISMLLGLFAVLASLPFLNRYKTYRFIWGYVPILLSLWMISHLVADIIYFENANKHIGYEGFVFLGKDLGVLLKSAFEQNASLSIGTILFLIVFLPLSTWLFLKYNPFHYEPKSISSESITCFAVLVLAVLGVRGGLQESPIRATNAIVSGNNFVNNLALNGVFTSIMDVKSQSIPNFLKMDPKQYVEIVRDEISYEGAEFVSEKYPLLREQKETNQGTPPNVILILLENWTGEFISPISNGLVDGKEVAPYFNRLLKKGRFFDHFMASGGRTTNGMMSILTGVPDRPGLTVVRTHQVLGNFSGIGTLFSKMGYETYFVTGGDLSFDNKNTLAPHFGFQTAVGEKEITKLGRYGLGSWGYDDADVLEQLHERASSATKPFFGVALTLTTHYPYRSPKDELNIFGKEIRDADFLNVYHYADWAVNQFMEKAEKSKYFKNTIFVFVADHTHHRYLDYYQDRRIPFLVYSPGRVTPGIDSQIASQLDVIPTILGLVGKQAFFSAMGRDLFAKKRTNSAYYAYGNLFGWLEGDTFYARFFDGKEDFAYSTLPPREKKNICEGNHNPCEIPGLKARAFLNMSYDLLNRNMVFPKESEFETGNYK